MSRLTIAFLHCFGKQPSATDVFNRVMMNGASVAIESFSSHVGSRSDALCLLDADLSALITSSTLTGSTVDSSGAAYLQMKDDPPKQL